MIVFGFIFYSGSQQERDFLDKISRLSRSFIDDEVLIYVCVHSDRGKELASTIRTHNVVFHSEISNVGYGPAYNNVMTAAQSYGADLAFFSNTDLEFDDQKLLGWVREIKTNASYCAPVQTRGEQRIYGSKFGFLPITAPVMNKDDKIDSALGAILYAKPESFHLRMDENYFMYNEEHDFFARHREFFYVTPSEVFEFRHDGAAASSQQYRLAMIKKNMGRLTSAIHGRNLTSKLSFLLNFLALSVRQVLASKR